MAIKNYKPNTAGTRHVSTLSTADITKTAPEKSLVVTLKKTGGRNNSGSITCRHIGGGNKRKYRIIDFKRRKDDMPATVLSIEYDPNRNARISLIRYTDGTKAYIICPKGLKVGDVIVSGKACEVKVSFIKFHVSLFTMLNFNLVKVAKCAVPLVQAHKSSVAKVAILHCVLLPAK